MSAIDLDLGRLAVVYLLLLIPVVIFLWLQLGMTRRTLLGVLRMTVQLGLVGLYLKYLFEWNHLWLNLAWVGIMLVAANLNILGNAGLKRRELFPSTLTATGASTLLVVGVLVVFAIRPDPLYDARYLVPITGMLLGNCLRSNIVCLERFFAAVQENRNEFMTYIYLGASRWEASQPYLRQALRASLAPHISTMATMGVVFLPGMMTGQILGGGNPVIAIKYQIAIMIAIFTSSALGAFLNIWAGMRISFDDYDRFREDIVRNMS